MTYWYQITNIDPPAPRKHKPPPKLRHSGKRPFKSNKETYNEPLRRH